LGTPDDGLLDDELAIACVRDWSGVVVNCDGLVGGGHNRFMSCRMTVPWVLRYPDVTCS